MQSTDAQGMFADGWPSMLILLSASSTCCACYFTLLHARRIWCPTPQHQLCPPVQFDPRTQAEIHAERDATLDPDYLAKRALRDIGDDIAPYDFQQLDRFDEPSIADVSTSETDDAVPVNSVGEQAWGDKDATTSSSSSSSSPADQDVPQTPAAATLELVQNRKPRVWVVMGGDGDQRQASLRTGVNVWAKLQRFKDIQVRAK